ncbi:alpha/beta hydrolase [Yimella sp. cx-573]|nr:alpha/beta hydrolase [Yimella sp. cx-573]
MSTISYSRKGAGEPVVLVHGIGHQRTAWFDVFDLLARDFDVIAIDLPGFGQSPPPKKPNSYAMSSWAQQLEEFFAHLDLGRPHIAGNSLGGILSLELAARGSVASCVALSPAGFYTPPGLMVAGAALVSMKAASHAPLPVVKYFADNPTLRRISMASLYVHPERLTAQDAYADSLNLRRSPGFWPCFVRGMKLNYRGLPQVPTTIAWGEKDRLLLPTQAKRARRRLPQVNHEPLPDCGHVPMLDDPHAIVRIVRETAARVPKSAEAVA